MSRMKSASALLAGAVMSVGALLSSGAMAADLPVKAAKAPVVGPSVPLDVHGWFDANFASNRVTGGGLLLYPSGSALMQVNVGLSLDIYKNPAGFVNSVSLYGGVWNEWWLDASLPGSRSWQEMDFYIGFTVGFAQHWKFSAEYVQFNFPNSIPTAMNAVFTLSYSDAHWGLPIPLNPYVSLFYNIDGGSTVVFGERDSTYRVTVGIVPTVALFKDAVVPLTLSFPTSVTFGPEEFWNRNDGTTNVCGATGTLSCELSSLAFYTTGIAAKWSLDKVIPKRLGSWYVKAAGHYYHIDNEALLAAQVVTGAATTFLNARDDVFVGTGGIGFAF
jgi:hypothetical protein